MYQAIISKGKERKQDNKGICYIWLTKNCLKDLGQFVPVNSIGQKMTLWKIWHFATERLFTLSVTGGCFFIPPIVNLMPFFCGVEFFFRLLMIFYVGDFNKSQCSQTFDLLLNILRNSAKKVSNPSLFWVKNQKILFFWVFSSISQNISL